MLEHHSIHTQHNIYTHGLQQWTELSEMRPNVINQTCAVQTAQLIVQQQNATLYYYNYICLAAFFPGQPG